MTHDRTERLPRFSAPGAGLALLLLFTAPGQADVINFARDTTFTIGFADNTFSGASVLYSNAMNTGYSGTGPTTELLTLNFLSTVVPGSLALTGDVALSSGGPPPTSEVVRVGTNGWGFEYTSTALTAPGPSFLTTGTSGGLATLNFLANSGGLVDAGFPFKITVIIPGDFSVSGTGAGDHMFNSLNSGFTITSGFIYNPVSHKTVFSATDSRYGGQAANLNFTLFGAAVPEPATGALMGIGIAAVGFAARRRRRAR